ncbi:MAG: DUF58 domain-containing protein [Gemmatimonadota bacterium]
MESSLSPDVVAAIDDLEIAARLVVEGTRAGGHRSPFRGVGTEFQQYRSYRAGDDLRHLDWKLYARSDRLFTRQFRETTDLAVQLVVDSSPSMAFPPTGVSKLRYAKIVAASLAYLVTSQGSAVGLATSGPGGFTYLPARPGTLHRSALIARLDATAPSPAWHQTDSIRHAADLMKRRGIMVIVSDFYDDEDATLRELRAVAARGHDVIMVQVLSAEEIAFGYRGEIELQDLESAERRLVDPSTVRAEYQRALQGFLARLRTGAGSSGIEYTLLSTDTAPEQAIRDLLLGRVR